jgi:hypothetical protein
VILVNSGTFWGINRAKGQPKMIYREKSSKHIQGQSWNAIPYQKLKKIDFGIRLA